jgi:hypothetical protein
MKNVRWIFLALLVSTTIFSALAVKVESQGTELQVTASSTNLRGGYNTSVSITIINNFESIYDVDVSVSFTSTATAASPTVAGISNWKLDKIDFGQNVTVKPLIFASADLAGNVYSASIAVSYKRLGYISPYTETHTIGFYVQGEVNMIAYDFTVDPDPVPAGSTVTIGASLLNKGNVAAMFTNVTLISSPILTLKPESHSYVGDVDPNSLSPFTIEATVRLDTQPGTYTVKLKVEFEDKESIIHTFERDVTVNVVEAQKQEPSGFSTSMIAILQILVPVTLAIVVIVVLIVRRRRTRSKSEDF